MAAEKRESIWRHPLLLLIISVPVTVAGTLLTTYLLSSKRELGYFVKDSVAYITPDNAKNVVIKVNDEQTDNIYATEILLRNTGTEPLKALPVRISLRTTSGKMDVGWKSGLQPVEPRIFNIQHSTIPPNEFGSINTEITNPTTRRFQFELLNPGDQDILTMLTSEPVVVAVESKSEGMTLNRLSSAEKTSWTARLGSAVAGGILGALVVVLGVVRRRLTRKKAQTQLVLDL